MSRYVTAEHNRTRSIRSVIQLTLIRVKVCLTKLTQALRHGIAAEPDPSRQLQERPVA